MGTDGAGLLHLTGRIPRIYSVSDGLSNGFVRSIFQDRDGQIWIGTDRGLFIRKGERFEQVRHGGELISFQVRSITQSRDGRIWIAGAQLISIEEDRSRVNNFPRPTELGFIETMLESGDGTLWLGADRSLAKISHGQIQEAVRFRSAVRALLERADHSLWIGTEGDGLWIYRDGSAKRLDSAGLLPSETIISLLEDEFGQIWIGTRGGLVRRLSEH
jgi:ligand-binding sensor domain-containing protein